jgi:hypothetical protein
MGLHITNRHSCRSVRTGSLQSEFNKIGVKRRGPVVSSPTTAKETGVMGHEVESRHGTYNRVVVLYIYKSKK